jgi:hypothetical protein
MTNTAGRDPGQGDMPVYAIRLQGHLDQRWAGRFPDMAFTFPGDGTTTLTGPLIDQAALHGLLAQIRDLGIPIISVQRL